MLKSPKMAAEPRCALASSSSGDRVDMELDLVNGWFQGLASCGFICWATLLFVGHGER